MDKWIILLVVFQTSSAHAQKRAGLLEASPTVTCEMLAKRFGARYSGAFNFFISLSSLTKRKKDLRILQEFAEIAERKWENC
jgi:hypothetical protein